MPSAAVIVFPGSNCDRDMAVAIGSALGHPPQMVWHGESALPKVDLIAIPGGFSYGDYLRSGAMAANSPIMREVVAQAGRGVPVLGICNGFQVLTECGLLPGVLMRNAGLKFICRDVNVRVERNDTIFTRNYDAGAVIRVPIAHHDGNFFTDPNTLSALEDGNRIAFRYCASDGAITDAANPNGSLSNIAGILNEAGNVIGMMPHPERLADPLLGGTDGKPMFSAIAEAIAS
ncbi:MAG: phosphoribosylformylglycinamidine synthase I [Alphaproteobacteria bacterium]|nr:phosphoribosylformylglycinamidine synthase I [Alphaproteobacteria bacterium]